MVVANQPTRSSKSLVNREPGRANGTPWVMTPCTGQHSRRRSALTRSRQAPRSRCRQVEDSALVSYRDLVVNSHRGQRSRRDRNRTPTTTASAENSTSVTVIPGRSIKRLNTEVTRTGSALPAR